MHGACHCPSVGFGGICCCHLSWPCSKKKLKKLCNFSKKNFQWQEIFKGFPIDRLSQMTIVLHNSFFFSRKKNFKNDKMRSHECIYFLFLIWKHIQSNVYSALLVAYGTPTKRVERAIFYWADLEINSGVQVTWANKPTTYIHILVKFK